MCLASLAKPIKLFLPSALYLASLAEPIKLLLPSALYLASLARPIKLVLPSAVYLQSSLSQSNQLLLLSTVYLAPLSKPINFASGHRHAQKFLTLSFHHSPDFAYSPTVKYRIEWWIDINQSWSQELNNYCWSFRPLYLECNHNAKYGQRTEDKCNINIKHGIDWAFVLDQIEIVLSHTCTLPLAGVVRASKRDHASHSFVLTSEL